MATRKHHSQHHPYATPSKRSKLMDTERHYQIIEFHEENCLQKIVDVVPTSWITYDIKSCRLVSPFPENLKMKKDRDFLHHLVRTKSNPLQSWRKWPIIIRGDSNNYTDALDKIKKLKTKKYAYTTDCEKHAEEKALKTFNAIKKKNFKDNEKLGKKLLSQVPQLDDEEDDLELNETNSLKDSSKDSSESDSENFQRTTTFPEAVIENKKSSTKSKEDNLSSLSKNDDISDNELYIAESPSFHQSKTQKPTDNLSAPDTSKKILNGINDIISMQRKLTLQITSMANEIRDVKEILRVRNINQDDDCIITFTDFMEKYELNMPFSALEDFQEFDNRLKIEKNFQLEFKRSIYVTIDRDNSVSKMLTSILRKLVKRVVMCQYTCLKQQGTKLIFKDTVTCRCIIDIVFKTYNKDQENPVVTEKSFFTCLGNVISNAKDWEGQRTTRKQSKE
nr:PREDICTED: uncharacterized protein LOC105669116 [Linepithema humile]